LLLWKIEQYGILDSADRTTYITIACADYSFLDYYVNLDMLRRGYSNLKLNLSLVVFDPKKMVKE